MCCGLGCNYEDISKSLLGKTLKSVTKKLNKNDCNNDVIEFVVNDDTCYWLTHSQECCENVWVEDICGDLNDLVGTPILMAEESVNYSDEKQCTWSFYRFSTIKGSVQIRFCGTSNGYYSEKVEFYKISKKNYF